MALVVKDRVQQTSTTVGTGTYTLSGSVTGYQDFSAIGNANTTYYAATNGTDWEVGIGTYTLSGTTLSRDTILASSNSGNAVNWGAGVKSIFVTYPADKSIYQDASGNTFVPNLGATTASSAAVTTLSASGVASFSAGSASAPAIVRATDTNTGVYWPAVDNIALATGGVMRVQVDASGNVGIGLVDPNYKLTVAGNQPVLRVFANTGNLNSIIYLSTSGDNTNTHSIEALCDNESAYANLNISTLATIFKIQGTESARINSSGSFGLGTSTPTNILSLGGNSARTFWMERHTTANTAGNNLTVQSGGATSGATDKNGGNLVLSSGTSTGTGSSQIIFNTATAGSAGTTDNAPAERMRVTGAGNVGVGVTNPEFKLVVSQATTYNTTGLVTTNSIFHFISESACNGWMESYGTGGIAINGRAAGGTSTSPSAIAADRQMMAVGARGYGTSQWSAAAVGLIGIYAAESFTNTANGTYIAFSTTPTGSVTRAERMRINADGKVGINGTNNGNPMLQVWQGSASYGVEVMAATSGTNSGIANIRLLNSGNTVERLGLVGDSDTLSTVGAASALRFSTVGSERVRIDSSGNVGIGTASPDALLTVNTIASFGDGAVGTPSIAHKGDLNTGMWFPAADTVAISTAGAEVVRIDSAGDVGIGVANPTAKLEVAGQICGAYNNTTGVANTAAQALGTNTMSMVLISANTTLTSTVPPAGARATVIIKTSGATSRTVTFGTGFKPQGTLATGNTADRFWAVNFISDGTFLYEVGRTTTAYA